MENIRRLPLMVRISLMVQHDTAVDSIIEYAVADALSQKNIRRLFGWRRWRTFWECLYKPRWKRELELSVDREIVASVIASFHVSGFATSHECNRAIRTLMEHSFLHVMLGWKYWNTGLCMEYLHDTAVEYRELRSDRWGAEMLSRIASSPFVDKRKQVAVLGDCWDKRRRTAVLVGCFRWQQELMWRIADLGELREQHR